MNTKGLEIFVVDDDRSFGQSLKCLLKANGYSVHCFESSQSFLDGVPSGQKGIAIIDLHMPQCDGFGLIELMKQMCYYMPVILVTGQTQATTRDEALRHGVLGFLQKPFTEQSLISIVESAGRQDDG